MQGISRDVRERPFEWATKCVTPIGQGKFSPDVYLKPSVPLNFSSHSLLIMPSPKQNNLKTGFFGGVKVCPQKTESGQSAASHLLQEMLKI